jgi:hypothetical protein
MRRCRNRYETRGPIQAAWIVDELIGIRALEQRLSEELNGAPDSCAVQLLDRVHDLNMRVEILDRALDELIAPGARLTWMKATLRFRY